MLTLHGNIYDEFVEFITSSPSLEAIAEFRLSEAAEQRISDLLRREREEHLSTLEAEELNEALRIEHIMRMAKIRAFEKLDAQ
jgi:hypothetical protein